MTTKRQKKKKIPLASTNSAIDIKVVHSKYISFEVRLVIFKLFVVIGIFPGMISGYGLFESNT